MELGKVIGQVVSTARDPGLPNLTFLLVNIVDEHGNVIGPSQVAADTIGAGEGEMVLLVQLMGMAKAPVQSMSWVIDSAQRAIAARGRLAKSNDQIGLPLVNSTHTKARPREAV